MQKIAVAYVAGFTFCLPFQLCLKLHSCLLCIFAWDYSYFQLVIVCRCYSFVGNIRTRIHFTLCCVLCSTECFYCFDFSFGQSTMDQKADPENPKSWPRFILRVDRHMCNYLTSGKRTRLAVLSSSLKVWILLKVCKLALLSGKSCISKNLNLHRSEF